MKAPDNTRLWKACTDAFLDSAATIGPRTHDAWLWLGHRNLRDRLFEEAKARGHPGWLDPPIAFFGDLARLFGIREKPVGLLTRRRLVSRHAARHGRDILGRELGRIDGVIRGHMLDSLFGDVLPEGISPKELEGALGRLDGDDFAERRNRWIVAVYGAYLDSLGEMGLRDWRSVNAFLAERIEAGELPRVLRGAGALHTYGITSARTRRRFLTALAAQKEVEVTLYLPEGPEPDPFFDALASDVHHLDGTSIDDRASTDDGASTGDGHASTPRVQPAPDAAREMAWVARRVKELLAAGDVEAHQIAVVARSGEEDTRRAVRALTEAGVTATARIRTPLSEIPALRALLLLFRGAGREWDYRSLRAVLAHPYFDTRVDLRGIDFIAGRRRVTGLAEWEAWIERLGRLVAEEAREVRGRGLFADRLEKDIEGLRAVREALDPLGEARTEAEWIDLTLSLLKEERGIFFLRRRVCDPVDERWDVVRSDQRGLLLLERLLREWRGLDHTDETLEPADWHGLLRKLLHANELVLSTPGQKGVQVLEAHDAALVPFARTFVVHANDGEFPRVPKSAGVLSDAERVRLAEVGIPVTHRLDALQRERTLWRAVTQQADPVWISYRTTDARGTPLLPSLMVPSHDPEAELPRVRRPRLDREPVTPGDADRLAAFRLHESLGAARGSAQGSARVEIAPARPERVRRAIVAAVAERHRGPGLERYPGSGEHPALGSNPWNGGLRDADVLAHLEGRFGDDYAWSAGQLETYARAPFLFLVDRVLWLEGFEEAEEETSPLAFGSVAHAILERFYDEFRANVPLCLDSRIAQRLDEIAEAVYREREAAGEWLGVPALWATSREVVRTAVAEYVAWELVYMAEKGERPHRVERVFGFDDDAVFIEGTDAWGGHARLRLRGRIDRIDRVGGSDTDAVLHHVLDYKSGYTPKKSDFEDATILQGALYMQVLADEGDEMCFARYRSIKHPGRPQNGGQIRFGSTEHENALALALSIPARVRAGCFEPVASRRGGWKGWDLGLEIRRNDAQVKEGHRFERTPGVRSPAGEAAGEPADEAAGETTDG